ncbi:MAG: nucleotidyltransferase domain-containing protein [Cyanobacteria bacterium P01_A01_bin.114]
MTFSTDLLDAKLAEQQAQAEATRQTLLSNALAWLQANAADYGVRQGYLFGSVTEAGRFRPASDIDLAIETLAGGQPFALIGAFSLQINREVDLVPLDQCHFADKIRRVGLLWTAAE